MEGVVGAADCDKVRADLRKVVRELHRIAISKDGNASFLQWLGDNLKEILIFR